MELRYRLIDWPESLITHFNQRGYRVVRFDNRDVGYSHDFSVKGFFHLIVRFLFFYVFGSVIYEFKIWQTMHTKYWLSTKSIRHIL